MGIFALCPRLSKCSVVAAGVRAGIAKFSPGFRFFFVGDRLCFVWRSLGGGLTRLRRKAWKSWEGTVAASLNKRCILEEEMSGDCAMGLTSSKAALRSDALRRTASSRLRCASSAIVVIVR